MSLTTLGSSMSCCELHRRDPDRSMPRASSCVPIAPSRITTGCCFRSSARGFVRVAAILSSVRVFLREPPSPPLSPTDSQRQRRANTERSGSRTQQRSVDGCVHASRNSGGSGGTTRSVMRKHTVQGRASERRGVSPRPACLPAVSLTWMHPACQSRQRLGRSCGALPRPHARASPKRAVDGAGHVAVLEQQHERLRSGT